MESLLVVQETINILPILGAILLLGLILFIFWKALKIIFKISIFLIVIGVVIKIITMLTSS